MRTFDACFACLAYPYGVASAEQGHVASHPYCRSCALPLPVELQRWHVGMHECDGPHAGAAHYQHGPRSNRLASRDGSNAFRLSREACGSDSCTATVLARSSHSPNPLHLHPSNRPTGRFLGGICTVSVLHVQPHELVHLLLTQLLLHVRVVRIEATHVVGFGRLLRIGMCAFHRMVRFPLGVIARCVLSRCRVRGRCMQLRRGGIVRRRYV